MNTYFEEYLPPVFQNMREFHGLAQTLDVNFQTTWDKLEGLFNNQFITTLDEYGCERWEAMLGLTVLDSYTVEVRRANILAKVNEKLPYDIVTFKGMLYAFVGDLYQLTVDPQKFYLKVRLEPKARNAIDAIQALCARILPANIVYEVEIKWNTYDALKVYTHGELHKYTQEELTFIEKEG